MLGAPGLDFETWETTDSMVRNHLVRDLALGAEKLQEPHDYLRSSFQRMRQQQSFAGDSACKRSAS
jgi:hypothetical protein